MLPVTARTVLILSTFICDVTTKMADAIEEKSKG